MSSEKFQKVLKDNFEVFMKFFRKCQQFFISTFLMTKFPKSRRIWGMFRVSFRLIFYKPFLFDSCFFFENDKKLYLVLEYCPGGELFFHLGRARRFTEQRARFYAAEILLALEYLHNWDIIYRSPFYF